MNFDYTFNLRGYMKLITSVFTVAFTLIATHVFIIGASSFVEWRNVFILHPLEWEGYSRLTYVIVQVMAASITIEHLRK